MYNPYNMKPNIERLKRERDELDNLINNYQQMPQQQPINNIINSPQPQNNQALYDLKVLNETDEAENIGVLNNTIFIGNNRLQIKKLDGTIEKYTIEKYYPIDPKDAQIKELNKKVEELERRLNNEHTKHNKSTNTVDKSTTTNDVVSKSEPTTSSK